MQQQPKADRVDDCVYRLRNPRQQIESYVGDVVRAQVPNMELEQVFVNKDAIADAVGQKITYSMADFGCATRTPHACQPCPATLDGFSGCSQACALPGRAFLPRHRRGVLAVP